MFDVVIYKPPLSAVQRGCVKDLGWVLEFIQKRPKSFHSRPGWCGTTEPLAESKLYFSSCEKAIQFAEKANLTYLFY